MATTLLLAPKPPQPILFFPSKFNFPIQNPNFPNHNHNFVPKIPFFSSSHFRIGSNPPETDCPVPFDQQPINEYQNLSNSFPFSWASGDLVEYCLRLFVTGASFALFIGLPVAWFGAFRPGSEPLERIFGAAAAASSGVLVVTLAVVRMYLGWAYVGNRLLSATVEYEETGWYDGQLNGTLSERGRLEYVNGKLVPPSMEDPDFDKWDKINSVVMNWLIYSMIPKIGEEFLGLTTAKEIWDTVANTYSKSSFTELESLIRMMSQLNTSTNTSSSFAHSGNFVSSGPSHEVEDWQW